MITRLVGLADGSVGLVQMNVPSRDEFAAWSWTRSVDDGSTWSPTVDLRGFSAVDDAWAAASVNWVEPDPWGAVHLIVRGVDATATLPAPSPVGP